MWSCPMGYWIFMNKLRLWVYFTFSLLSQFEVTFCCGFFMRPYRSGGWERHELDYFESKDLKCNQALRHQRHFIHRAKKVLLPRFNFRAFVALTDFFAPFKNTAPFNGK